MTRRYRNNFSTLGLALGLACAATPAHAIFMDRIEITNAFPNYIQISELQLLEGGNNVALASNGAIATATSMLDADSAPSNAIDGVIILTPPHLYHSATPGAGEKLTITLSGGANVSLFTIYTRSDCCMERDLYDYYIYYRGALVTSGQKDARNIHHRSSVEFGVFEEPPPAVPEPASWALLIAGFGAVGFALRRRTPPLAHMA